MKMRSQEKNTAKPKKGNKKERGEMSSQRKKGVIFRQAMSNRCQNLSKK